MRDMGKLALVMLGAAVAGCTTAGGGVRPVDVTRYHLGTPVTRGTVAIEPVSTNQTISPEYQTYAAAVSREMQRLGFQPVAAAPSDYIAAVSYLRGPRGIEQRRSPVSVGLGGGSFGGGGGVGGGLSFGLGGGQREVVGIELAVQIRRRGDNTTVWEGRAVTETITRTDAAQPIALADRLAVALFGGFPGQSGITTTVE